MTAQSSALAKETTGTMRFTPQQSRYWATLLTLRGPAGSIERLGQSLSNARVDLNPHQVDAALFAIRSPLSKGVLFADEVGLGKTIEAALVIAQRWAERRRKILLVVPATLRKQWQQELLSKFDLPSEILESADFRNLKNAFDQPDKLVICSYQLAASRAFEMRAIEWDLVIIDEAHRLRNVYRKSSRIAADIREAILNCPKILLTATPLQNSLMELYGMVSVIDPHIFGDQRSFKRQFCDASPESQRELRDRLRPICIRTLRRQVLEYVRFTKRHCITRDFYPTEDEHRLYEDVSAYLQRPNLVAIPNGQRKLITLVLRKLLASSTFAIAKTLLTMVQRVEAKMKTNGESSGEEPLFDLKDYESEDDTHEEWLADSAEEESNTGVKPEFDPRGAAREATELRGFFELANRVRANAKGQQLLIALEVAFEKAESLGGQRKAVIFTESLRTQNYLVELLSENGYKGQIVLMNALNADHDSRATYQRWLERYRGTDAVSGSQMADLKAAVVEEFRDRATLLIATESAAEGVNLQFCSLVVNYDLPWNPQRIEQRIGRCHRYGQANDVVVVNFVNQRNAADQHVYSLLKDKFRLFDGVFGASDEVLGAVESGVDLEKRIAAVYQNCRTCSEIDAAFTNLQLELEDKIEIRMAETHRALLENFDADVHGRLKLSKEQAVTTVSERQHWLANLLKAELSGSVEFTADPTRFRYFGPDAPHGFYNLDWPAAQLAKEYFFQLEHPLAQQVLSRIAARALSAAAQVTFHYRQQGHRVAMLEPLIGQEGWMQASLLSVKSFETEEFVLLSGLSADGVALSEDHCKKLLSLPANEGPAVAGQPPESLAALNEQAMNLCVEGMTVRNEEHVDKQLAKLDCWADDLKLGLEHDVNELDRQIRNIHRQKISLNTLEEKLDAQKRIKALETARGKKRRELFEAQDKIDSQRDELIEAIEKQMKHHLNLSQLFTLKWSLTD